MNQLPPPEIEPFQRFQASDGLLINAQRWKMAHNYHRKRDNYYYQSLYQPGVVCGLEIRILGRNTQDVPGEYQNEHSIQIQPGIAIDLKGNFIVVPKPHNIVIRVQPSPNQPLIIYLGLAYRDPDQLKVPKEQEIVREEFRFDIKIQPLNPLEEIELARIALPKNQPLRLTKTQDIFAPNYHNLDFRYRQQVAIRPQKIIQVAQIKYAAPDYNSNYSQLQELLNSTSSLYPQLQALERVRQVDLNKLELIKDYHLLYLFVSGQTLNISSLQRQVLNQYLAQGGVLLIDVPGDGFDWNGYFPNLKPLTKEHFLRRHPFLFAALPPGANQPHKIEIFTNQEGVIIVKGNLGSFWGLDANLALPRIVIRTAQELGINILNFAWHKHTFSRLNKE